MPRYLSICLLLCGGLATVRAGAAPVVAAEYATATAYTAFTDGNFMVGWEFDLAGEVLLTSLGAYLAGTFAPDETEVGLWNSAGTLLASAVVQESDLLLGHFYYRDIAPVALPAGTGYTIGALWQDDKWFVSEATGVAVAPEVTFVESRHLRQAAVLTLPTAREPQMPADSLALGPNFRFTTTAVPEPATLALLGLGAAALVRRRR